jgi:hypothetical protein
VSVDRPDLLGRCGTCARFVRVTEITDENGEVKRRGECLLGAWPPPIYETNTCSQYVQKGTFGSQIKAKRPAAMPRRRSTLRTPQSPGGPPLPREPTEIRLPEDLLEMDADEFRQVLTEVIRDELGVSDVELGGRWIGGEMILKPGKEGTAEKRISIDSLFHKVIMIRDKLRVLEQKVNSSKLTDEEKVQLQQYITQCYGSLTTFNVLFANKNEQFVGQKGDE